MPKKYSKSSVYWAKAPVKEIAKEVENVWTSHHAWLQNTGLKSMIQSTYDAYYNFSDGGFGITKSNAGSSANIKINHLKSLVERVKSMVVEAKLAYNPKAINSSASSMIQSDFAKGLLDFYATDKNMTAVVRDMVEMGLVCLDSFVYAPWDWHQGEEIAPGVMGGDQDFKILTRFDVASHPKLTDSPYFIIRQSVNKWDLAARYHKWESHILDCGVDDDLLNKLITPLDSNLDESEDLVDIYILIHKKTLALPKGRLSIICGGEVLEDSALSYRRVPVVHFQPGKILGTTSGDSPITALVSLQQGIDALYSAVITNNLAYSRQSLYSPSPIEIEPLSEGLNLLVGATKPEPIQLVASSTETYNLIQTLQQQQQLLSGVNDVARGNPQASLKSGTSLSTMLAVALQFANDTQQAYAQAAGELASIVIANLQEFCDEPRLAYIGGNSRKSQVKTFTKDDIASIRQVTCEIGNPLVSSLAGRQELINSWQQYGLIRDPSKVVEFLKSGQAESLLDQDFEESTLIKLEGESILRGEVPPVTALDSHQKHIMEHKALLNDLEARHNPVLVEATLAHIQQHIEVMKTLSPDLAAILGIPPLPSQQAPVPAPEEQAGVAPDPAGLAAPIDTQISKLPPNFPQQQ